MRLSVDGQILSEETDADINAYGLFTILNSVTSIGVRAFFRCTGLTSLTLPDSVTSIDGDWLQGP